MIRYLLLLGTASLAVPAAAMPMEEVRRVSVPVEASRLDDPAVVATVRARIGKAADDVCALNDRSLQERSQRRKCRDAALADANGQLSRLIARPRVAAVMVAPSN